MPFRRTGAAAGVAAMSLLLATPAQAQAQDAKALHLRSLAATCTHCHGTDGRAHKDGAVPGLAGLSSTHIATQLRDFRDGRRTGTIMHQLAKGYTDEQIDAIAAYFAAQTK